MIGKITKEDFIPPEAGEYYRCVKYDKPINKGELVIVTEYDEDDQKVHFTRLGSGFFSNVFDFIKNYALAPEGKAEREADLQELLNEFHQMKVEEKQIANALQNLDRPLIAAHEEELNTAVVEVAGADEISEHQNTALLVQTPDAIQARKIKKGVALMRNEALKFGKRFDALQKRIGLMKDEQEAFLEAILKQKTSLTKMVEIAQELIWTVNIYLGRGEEIVQLREGKPAEPEEKISVRQLVLYADEEMAIRPLEGGIDFTNLDQIDQWLLQKNNLQQVLPESRGIIVFKPRHKSKDYTGGSTDMGAAMLNAEYNKKNAQTYFLMRNGENLYRVTTDIIVGGLLVPTSNEFDELFEKSEYNYTTGERVVRKVKPGTKEFSEAMKNASESQRHYGRILLFMQGIIDRTKIFVPLISESTRVNLLDRKNHESYIRYIYDGQNLLPTGRLPFWKWVGEVNKNIDVGHRIIGIFNDYDYGIKRDREKNRYERITPGNADRPDNLQLYTIEGRKEDGYVIRYKRTDKVRRRVKQRFFTTYEEADPKTRASCLLYKDDRFYLDFDRVNVEDMKFYLTSRVDRSEYITMFPLIETTLALKEKEMKEEAPFRELLIGQIAKEHEVDFEEAREAVDDLIIWWKFKNPTHRALAADDSKALRMIVQEFGLRRIKENQMQSSLNRIKFAASNLVESYAKSTQHLLYVGYRGAGLLSVLVAENEEDIFIDEQIWRVSSSYKYPEIVESRRWRTADTRHQRWKKLYESERWTTWRTGLRADQFLTDWEIYRITHDLWYKVEKQATASHYRREKGTNVFWPIAICMDSGRSFRCWFYDDKLEHNPKQAFLANKDLKDPYLGRVNVSYTRKDGTARASYVSSNSYYDCSPNRYSKDHEVGSTPWFDDEVWDPQVKVKPDENGKLPNYGNHQQQRRLLWINHESILKYQQQYKLYRSAQKQIDGWLELLNPVVRQAIQAMRFRWESIEYQKYLAEHGDKELWQDELKTRRKIEPQYYAESFKTACRQLIVQGKSLIGLKVEDIIQNTLVSLTPIEVQYLPLDLVIKPEPKETSQEIEEENEEDVVEDPVWEKPVN